MYPNPLKQKLRDRELILGTYLPAATPMVTAQICQTAIDFLWIDTEHSPYSVEALDVIPLLARQLGVAPLVRVAWNDPALIKKAYDIGAVAVMVPQVNCAEEAARAVQYAFYPPIGQRGVSPYWPIMAGVDWGEVIRSANDETVLILQIETVQAYEQLDDIAQIPGIDVLLVGPLDLSASLGMVTRTDAREVQEIMRDIPRRLRGSNIAVGTTLNDLSELEEKIGWGYRFLNVGDPLGYGIQVLSQNLNILRSDSLNL